MFLPRKEVRVVAETKLCVRQETNDRTALRLAQLRTQRSSTDLPPYQVRTALACGTPVPHVQHTTPPPCVSPTPPSAPQQTVGGTGGCVHVSLHVHYHGGKRDQGNVKQDTGRLLGSGLGGAGTVGRLVGEVGGLAEVERVGVWGPVKCTATGVVVVVVLVVSTWGESSREVVVFGL